MPLISGKQAVSRPKAYSYIRMSTAEQAKGDSARRQDKATSDYAKENNLELVDILIDKGVSAFTGSNAEFGELGRFIALAERGEIEKGSYLIVESLDRISRDNIFKALGVLQSIINLDINIVTLSDKKVYSKTSGTDSQGDLIFAIFTLIRAHEESQMKSLRLKASWDNKRNLARMGSATNHVIPKWLRYSEDKTKIELIEERADIIKEIFELSCSGWGAYSIAKLLNSRGEKTWGNAKFWQESYIKKITHNRSVLGEYQPYITKRNSSKIQRIKYGDPILDYYPKVIDVYIFQEAQEMIRKRAVGARGRKGNGLANLFSGLLFCNYCGSSLRFMNKGKPPKGGKYLRCTKSLLTGECSSPTYNYPDIEILIISVLRQLDIKNVLMDEKYRIQFSSYMKEKAELTESLNRTQLKVDRLLEALEKTDVVDLVNAANKYDAEKQNIQKRIYEIDQELDKIHIPESDVRTGVINLLTSEMVSEEERMSARVRASSIVKNIVRKISIHSDKIHPWDNEDASCVDEKNYINLDILYKNGAKQVWYGNGESNMYMPPSGKINIFKNKIRNESLE